MKTYISLLTIVYLASSISLFAHGGEKHEDIAAPKPVQTHSPMQTHVYSEINNDYLKNVKAIFLKKCFDCHGSISTYPWYYSVPGVKQMIDYDTTEAKKHLDMSKDFPFVSHETPLEDLKSLREVAKTDSMPPLRYLLGHWDGSLSDEEKAKIMQWTQKSLLKLEGKNHE